MRDPRRIRKFCNRLATAWELFPDLRFGQLVYIIFSQISDEQIEKCKKKIDFIKNKLINSE
mgnify:CR=1 FL=1